MMSMENCRSQLQNRRKSCYDESCRLLGNVKHSSIDTMQKLLNEKSILLTTMNETLNR
jgi:hypothetical protein